MNTTKWSLSDAAWARLEKIRAAERAPAAETPPARPARNRSTAHHHDPDYVMPAPVDPIQDALERGHFLEP